MSARLPSDLLERSAQESSRLLALTYLDQIDQAHARLRDILDRDALHDFRVGLRRLRSAMRAYGRELEGSVRGKMRRRLRNLARATNDGRDIEVQLAWLVTRAGQVGPDDVRGFFWLVGRLEERKHRTQDSVTSDVARRYGKAARRLRRALGILRIEVATGQGQRLATFREVTGALARQQVARVREELARIRHSSDADQVHRARISLKRLRYLLEPVARRNRRAGALVRRLKEAQDLLGEYHDMHVLSAAVDSLRAGIPAGSFAGLDPGLATVRRLADEATAGAFERFQSIWGGELGNRILLRAEELGSVLQEPSLSAQPHVPELKPEIAVGELPSQEIEQPTVTETRVPMASSPEPITNTQ